MTPYILYVANNQGVKKNITHFAQDNRGIYSKFKKLFMNGKPNRMSAHDNRGIYSMKNIQNIEILRQIREESLNNAHDNRGIYSSLN